MSKPSSSPKARAVSASYAARNFASLVNRVQEERAACVVERHGKPVAEIRPVDDRMFTVREFVALFPAEARRPADEEYLRAVEEGIAFHNRAETPESPWDS
ncbi:MAG: type II toxin-antitoxin system Phd/YefM family antitoxin [Gemmatimonadetes bacterium]|nr:type II toxin-antitoxin system Phd/YefM family antitoxin [Gemmatimonadota bacterium]MYA44593.1 type II toxin-antitoxin system Phd/YefM family antitoxin [Gemmatimonadota bacterium]MYE93184.1 type II toxin-antitoxin system Phd/YefM family antitoxin [Gemmatimonadota bacterium]MYJ10858.1 type II toxin-antitoxin system Phd/YefM family antitoxin [Gemmatimonadota bacterium]